MAIRQRAGKTKFSADVMMLTVASSLIRDFQRNLDDFSFCSDQLAIIRQADIAKIRQVVPRSALETDDIARYKAYYQVESLLKRYRFKNDLYSDQELQTKAIESFIATQRRLADLDLTQVSSFTNLVLDRAARYIAECLGMYDDEEHRHLCRFGRRASVGIPAREACEASRWEIPISGSQNQISWFDSEMSQIDSVQDYWARQMTASGKSSVYQEIDSLALTLVPKTFKSLRSIMPNSTIGSYMSFGLGEMIRRRLKRKGYDIRSLQHRHRDLARRASSHGLHVTADLSAASDSITDALIERLFPPDWVEILRQSRIETVVLPDSTRIKSLTFCTMGIGYTFPLQTLVFLALLKGIQSVLYKRTDQRTISVYGDDMIYHSRMHNEVLLVFSEIGFVINVDKTYHEGHFRESCGGDYYRGVDVRPFQPRNGAAIVSQKTYEAMLYKFINGLLTRWTEHEIGNTLNYLTSEIERCTGSCKLVPADFPDDSGIKCEFLDSWDFLRIAKCAKPKHIGHGVYRFSYLRLKTDLRKEDRHEPYYWFALRAGVCQDSFRHFDFHSQETRQSTLARRIDDLLSVEVSTPLLIAREERPIRTTRSKLTGRRLRRIATFVTVSHTGRYTRQSGTSCFGARR